MPRDIEESLSDDATFAGRPRPQRTDVSIGDERTLSDVLAGQETIIDDIEVVDLAARYRIDGTLGQGGMGAVILATDTRLDRKVAIKRILGEAAGNRMAVNRFLTEAKSIAALNHPNIVQIYDYGRAKDGPFLIMEYVDGGSLLDRCRDGAIPLDDAVDLACHLCDGLAKAHDLGIIHRDIKPSNILLTSDGIPKLTDFGLAKAKASDQQMTMTGAVMGTPDFMPPEQRRDAALVDHRSDLWSLAATLYQAVSGRSPKVIRLHELPQELQPIIGKALEDEKESRYQSAREFRDALRTALEGGRKSTSPAKFNGVLQEGQCKACGTVTSDLTKKFCRSPQCGASLRVACLKCDAQMPAWDGVCGECGGNQPALLEAKRKTLEAKRAKAEALLADLAFDEAIGLANEAASEARIELADLVEWAPAFVAATTVERDRRRSSAAERLQDARKHVAACDYPAAIQSLEMIPHRLRDAATSLLLSDCQRLREESEELLAEIAGRIGRKEIKGLLPLVERAAGLRGDRADLVKIKGQLVDRLEERIRHAQTAFEGGDSFAAANALSGAAVEELGESVHLLDRVTRAAEEETRLLAFVKAAKIDGVVSGDEAREIVRQGEACLAVNPASDRVKRIVGQAREILEKQVQRQRKQEEEQQRQKEEVAKRVSSQILACPAVTNSVGISLKLLPAGSFTMGDVTGVSADKPHRVTLTRPFYLGAYEVTNAQWKKVMGSVPSNWKRADHPVEQVSWEDAVEFCRKLSALPEERKAGRVYRLPTEAEWEYACRAGTTTQYWFGDDEKLHGAYGWFTENSGSKTHPVGKKKPNAWGLYDMHGNVWELCSEWYVDYPDGEVTNPQGLSSSSYRGLRGGGWNTPARDCRSACRTALRISAGADSTRWNDLGFRLALNPAGAKSPEAGK